VRRNAFGLKTKRFGPDDTIAPGPGQYAPQKQACNVRDAKKAHAGMLSTTDRPEIYSDPSMPGVGNYNVKDHLSIGL